MANVNVLYVICSGILFQNPQIVIIIESMAKIDLKDISKFSI
jgi:hypothetical protein